ncbi:hypothetical protein [Roseicyclus mahoneyensis]|jgi:hypothetical protein|uniref:FlgN protein n=1 Tax=Roseicyclus mahoneyensis TaxID=164332 RepID=A0A316GGS3_9RHOB|nr:hypothetical protein [Roseicyclus mahoneyensis]PWK59788.1 hypothetical protein C7455_10674 [Roseicyclus mahoneyensis]
MTRADRSLATIEALLTTQHEALLAGDLDQLARMPHKLEQALQSLSRQDLPEQGLARVATLAARNARLIVAAQRGLAQARDLRPSAPGAPLSTYDALGRQSPPAVSGRLLSRG